jgi:hypothetical protein
VISERKIKHFSEDFVNRHTSICSEIGSRILLKETEIEKKPLVSGWVKLDVVVLSEEFPSLIIHQSLGERSDNL